MSTVINNDPFEKLNVRIKGAPRTYTIIHHILYELTPRELAPLERVCKSWNKAINSDTELWWNKWMSLVWGQKNITGSSSTSTPATPRLSEANLKDLALLQNSLTFSELNSTSNTEIADDNISYSSSVTTLTDISNYDSSYSFKKSSSVSSLNTSRKISRAERKRGPKIWKKLAIDEYRKQEVRNVFVSSMDVDEDSDSDDTIINNTQEKSSTSNVRGKLTTEEKIQARSMYKTNRAKPKSKNSWRNSSNVSKEWMAFEDYYNE